MLQPLESRELLSGDPYLTLALASHSVLENAGLAATTATVTRNNMDTSQALTVNLSSGDPQVTVPSSVTIAAGNTGATFNVGTVDDHLNGPASKSVAITGTAVSPVPPGLDSTFGSGGYLSVPQQVNWSSNFPDMKVQSDGKVVAVSSSPGSSSTWAISRSLATGALDTGFGTNGTVVTSFPGATGGYANGVAIQPDGKIVVVGVVTGASTYDAWGIARYNSNGSPDSTFGTNGLILMKFTGESGWLYDGAVLANGEILVGGMLEQPAGFAVARFTSKGQLDTSFGSSGIASVNPDPTNGWYNITGQSMTVQPDGKILMTGIGNYNYLPVTRFNANGSLDSTFGNGGTTLIPLATFGSQFISIQGGDGLAVQADGKIIVDGWAYETGYSRSDWILARLNVNGTLDTGFNGSGVTTLNFAGGADKANDVAIAADGKIMVAGRADVGATLGQGYNLALARFNTNGTLDTTFNGNGEIIFPPLPSVFEEIWSVDFQPDGKLDAVVGYNTDMRIARFDTGLLAASDSLSLGETDIPAQLKVSGLTSPATAGSSETFSVTAEDATGATVLNYSGTVHFTSSDPSASLPENYAFMPSDNGTHSFSVTFATSGTQSVTATDTVTSSITGSQSVTVQNGVDDFLVTASNNVYHYTLSGSLLGTLPVPYPTGSSDSQIARGLTVDANQNIDLFNGTFTPYLSTYNTGTKSWSQHTVSGWSTVNNVSYGGVAGFNQYVFVTDMATGGGQDQGLIRFNTADYSYQRFATTTDYIKVTVGQDGYLYALEPSELQVDVFNPVTLALKRHIFNYSANADSRGIAVDGNGQIFVADWNGRILHFDPAGNLVQSLSPSGGGNWADIILGADGKLVAVSWSGTVLVSDESLSAYSTYTLPSSSTISYFLSWAQPQTPTLVADSLSLSPSPTSIVAGNTVNVTVTAQDILGNTVAGYTGTVHFTSTDSQATLPADYAFTAADQGSHTFTVTLRTAGNESVTATDLNPVSPITGNGGGITVNAGPTNSFAVSGFSTPITAGVVHNFTVMAVDAYGNLTAGYTGTVHFTSSDIKAVLPANYTFTAADSGQHSFSATLKTAGNQSITATDTVTASVTGVVNVSVVAGLAKLLVIKGLPTGVLAGVAKTFSLSARDGFGNLATGYTGTVHFSSSDAQAALPADYVFNASDAGVHVFTNGLTFKTAGSQKLTAVDTTNGLLTGTGPSVSVTAAAAQSLTVTGFANPDTAGVSGQFTVTLFDAYGNQAAGYRGTLHFTSSDVKAVLPTNYVFTAADAGQHSFSATLKTAGGQSITATDIHNTSITGKDSVTVIAASAASYSFGVPVSTVAGSAKTFTLTAKDAYGNVATGYAGTVHFSSSDSQAVVPTDYTFVTADGGTHIFTHGLVLKTAGLQSLTATDTANGALTATRSNIQVNPAAAKTLSIAGFPSPITAGNAGSFTVTAKDAYGNIATGYTGTIHFTSSDSSAQLPADYTFAVGDNGVHTFSATLNKVGKQSISAADTIATTIKGSQTGIEVDA
jgi:uncharacterized delta-60 repeat protein